MASNEFGIYSSKFQAYVAWVDHNSTLGDMQKEGSVESISPQTGRGLHLGVFRLGGFGSGIALNVVVPQDVLGSFKVPQVGDIIWVEETRREYGKPPIYLYSAYNGSSDPSSKIGQSPVPQWGSFSGDYGHLRTHRDHNKQFLSTINSNFIRKFVRSITGYRFRSFYRGNLKKGRFAVRGDSVFDIGGTSSEKYLVEDGAYVGYGGDLESDQGNYPNPLNVPETREDNEDYTYINPLYEPIENRITADHYDFEDKSSVKKDSKEKIILKNLDYLAYQPILDKSYLDKADFERELPAAEEYQVALRGNNKLLIQDQYGDGEQLLITLKNQYDAGITILHNGERGQIRVRDHLGQGVLFEANPDAPRVISWTANRQVIEQGAIKDIGEFTYIRNGSVFGDSDTSFGTKTGLTKNDVSNQEFLMVSTSEIIGELSTRLSSGMNSLIGASGAPGVYIRNNVDPDESEQTYALYKAGANMVVETTQNNLGVDGANQLSSIRQELDGSAVIQTLTMQHDGPGVPHEYLETVVVSEAEATKTTILNRVGSDTITTTESITNDNTASFTRNITLLNSNQIVYTEDGSVPSVTTNLLLAGVPVADVVATGTEIQTLKYVGGAPASLINQDENSIDIERLAAGATFLINIGNDSGTGVITIGNSTSNMNINGNAVNVTGAGAVTIAGASIDLNA